MEFACLSEDRRDAIFESYELVIERVWLPRLLVGFPTSENRIMLLLLIIIDVIYRSVFRRKAEDILVLGCIETTRMHRVLNSFLVCVNLGDATKVNFAKSLRYFGVVLCRLNLG
jgi:hypothetical protein